MRMVKVTNPETGETQILDRGNASDVCQHLGWQWVGVVDVSTKKPEIVDPQKVIDNVKNLTSLVTSKEEGATAEAVEEMSEDEVKSFNKKKAKASKE